MVTETQQNPPRRAAARRREWEAFESGLAQVLGCLEDGHFLILSTRDEEPYYVQFAAEGDEGMRVEAVSNRFLHGWRRLDATAEGRLRRLGWRPPTDIGEGPVNWWLPFEAPLPASHIAALTVATLTKAYDVSRVSAVAYHAFSRDDEEILLPTLGLERLAGVADGEQMPARVDRVFRELLGVDELIRDADGDIPIRNGDVMVYVRIVPDRNYVAVYSPAVVDIDHSPALIAAVNEVNLTIRVARASVGGHEIVFAAEVDDGPGLESSVINAYNAVASLANSCGADLQSRFGGRTYFQESPPPDPDVHIGLYL